MVKKSGTANKRAAEKKRRETDRENVKKLSQAKQQLDDFYEETNDKVAKQLKRKNEKAAKHEEKNSRKDELKKITEKEDIEEEIKYNAAEKMTNYQIQKLVTERMKASSSQMESKKNGISKYDKNYEYENQQKISFSLRNMKVSKNKINFVEFVSKHRKFYNKAYPALAEQQIEQIMYKDYESTN